MFSQTWFLKFGNTRIDARLLFFSRGSILRKGSSLVQVFNSRFLSIGGGRIVWESKLPDSAKLKDDPPSFFGVVISTEPLPVADFDRNLLLLRLRLLLLSLFGGLKVCCL